MQVTIITVVYNRAATIGGAIESVARQTYPNLEHLVIDGQSTDGTLGQIHNHAHERIRVISEPDSGIYDALNKGTRLARGEIVGLVHSDDFLADDGVIARVVAGFSQAGTDAVYGDLDYVAADNPARIVRRWKAGPYHEGRLRRGWMPPHPALFIHRRLIEAHGAYDTSYRIAADYDAILRWFGRGAITVQYLPEVLVKMRVGGESNRSLERIFAKSREDYRALTSNGIGGLGTLALKNVTKLPQFFVR